MRVTVVGAGIMGLSAAWALSRGGHDVVVFDQGPVPNPKASSVDSHRAIRQAYGGMEGYCRMVEDAFAAWDGLWADLGRRHYIETGVAALSGGEDGDWADLARADFDKLGIPYQTLEGDALWARFPHLRLDDIAWALVSNRGGALLADRIVADLAARLGERVRPHTPIAEIDPARACVTLQGGKIVGADLLVVAAGAWTPRLLPALAKRVTPSRQAVIYVSPPEQHLKAWSEGPMLVDISPSSGFYALPPMEGLPLKIGDHLFSLVGDPEEDRQVAEAHAREILKRSRGRFRDFDGYRLAEGKACFYSVAREERFILERVEKAWIMTGFSGHGFKFAPLLGSRLADAVDGRLDGARLTDWAAGRMEREDPFSLRSD